MNADENDRLIDDLLEGDITDADFLRLEAELIVSPEAREAYYDRLKLHTGLQEEARSASESDSGAAPTSRPPKRKLDPILFAALGVLALLVAFLGWKVADETPVEPVEPTASGFGVLADLVESEWGPGLDFSRGDLVPAEPVILERGMARIELFNGVVLVVEGPATFTLESDSGLFLEEGRIQARIPPVTTAFELNTPMGIVEPRGLEFAVEVLREKITIDVINGTADWRTPEGNIEIIIQGSALQQDREGGFEIVPSSAVSMSDVEAGFDRERRTRLQAWQQNREELLKDSGLLAYYAMQPSTPGQRTLVDLTGNDSIGAVVLTDEASDRWNRTQSALDFSPMGSRVRVTVPGEHESLSLMCWVRIDSLDRLYNSLFLTDGHELHEPHWQIMNDGRIFFSVRATDSGKGRDKHIAFSPPIWNAAQSGQWMHIATVYDGEAQTITHYVNGEPITIEPIPENLRPDKVLINSASIGNWSEPRYRKDPDFAVRNLNGTLDDFGLWNRPLSAAEVQEIYSASRP
ncbi:MAG: LamG-like jellyroll fold domain-containing protein [Verrucomicrobiota bacterium]